MTTSEKPRPALLEFSKDKTKNDMIMRIVSPITPHFVSLDMRDTLKISEVIRLQQNELIALGNYEKRTSPSNQTPSQTPMLGNWSDTADFKTASSSAVGENDVLSEQKRDAQETSVNSTNSNDTSNGNYTTDNNLTDNNKPAIEIDCDSENESVNDSGNDANGNSSDSSDSSPLEGGELERISSALQSKKLKRNNAPGPLRISPKAFNASMAPAINLAPMRPLYGPHALRRAPVRYVYPSMGYLPPTAVHYMPTPVRRNGLMPERVAKPRLPRGLASRRRKPVLDVFEGQVAKLAPMPSQPPSAQLEKFDVSHSDNEAATQEEMEEMEMKRKRANSALKGSILFNDESAFNFTLFQGNESSAKKKFLEVCETTWDKYMASSTGA